MSGTPTAPERAKPTIIKATENGPLRVKGPITVVDADGIPYEITRKTFFLCRCGASSNKPFCDGSHSRIGFTAAERAAGEAAAAGARAHGSG